jgi:urease subunit beta
MIPGEYFLKNEALEANSGRATSRVTVTNRGDRPIQVGSHCHFFEVNRALDFDRRAAYGKRLNIPAGSAIRARRHEGDRIGGARRNPHGVRH